MQCTANTSTGIKLQPKTSVHSVCKRQRYASARLERDHNQDEFKHNPCFFSLLKSNKQLCSKEVENEFRKISILEVKTGGTWYTEKKKSQKCE